jgi:hypothetical protein
METAAAWYFGVFSLSGSAGSGKEKLIVSLYGYAGGKHSDPRFVLL